MAAFDAVNFASLTHPEMVRDGNVNKTLMSDVFRHAPFYTYFYMASGTYDFLASLVSTDMTMGSVPGECVHTYSSLVKKLFVEQQHDYLSRLLKGFDFVLPMANHATWDNRIQVKKDADIAENDYVVDEFINDFLRRDFTDLLTIMGKGGPMAANRHYVTKMRDLLVTTLPFDELYAFVVNFSLYIRVLVAEVKGCVPVRRSRAGEGTRTRTKNKHEKQTNKKKLYV